MFTSGQKNSSSSPAFVKFGDAIGLWQKPFLLYVNKSKVNKGHKTGKTQNEYKESGVNTVNGCVPTVNCKGVLKIKVYFARIRRPHRKNSV